MGYLEVVEIGAGVLGLLVLVGVFVCIRKRYVQQKKKKKKPVCAQDSSRWELVLVLVQAPSGSSPVPSQVKF